MSKNKINKSNKILFLILDGWGIYNSYSGNAIAAADTPAFDKLVKKYPATVLNVKLEAKNNAKPQKNCVNGHFILGGYYKAGASEKPGIAEIFLKAGKAVIIISESEKYAQLAQYFCHSDLSGEDNFVGNLISSPRLDDYSNSPELSADKVINKIVKAVNSDKYDLVVGNISNPDILAHTGNFSATVEGVGIIDKLLKKAVKAALNNDFVLVIAADHGNAEYMENTGNGQPHTGHALNPIPFIVASHGYEGRNIGWPDVIGDDLSTAKAGGRIIDVAPTILFLAGLKKPGGMMGKTLIGY